MGIATVSISITKALTAAVGVPRVIFVKWPLGHPLGEPSNGPQQRTILFEALLRLATADRPGEIVEPGYRWKRERYVEPDWSRLAALAAGAGRG